MVTDELIRYVRQQLDAGHKKEGLRTLLVANGWQEKDIDEAYAAIQKNPTPPDPKKQKSASAKSRSILLMVLLGVIVLGGLYWYFALRTPASSGNTVSLTATPTPTASQTITQALALGVATGITDTSLQLTFVKREPSSEPAYTLRINSPQNTACLEREVDFTQSAAVAVYNCGSTQYTLEFQSSQSDLTTMTVKLHF